MSADDEQRDYSHLFLESPPAQVRDAAQEAFAASGAGELAALTFDSLVDGHDTAASYRLAFESSMLTVEAFVSKADDHSSIALQTSPHVPARVRMDRWGDDQPLVPVAAGDRLRFESVPNGSVRLIFEDKEGKAIAHTDWFRI